MIYYLLKFYIIEWPHVFRELRRTWKRPWYVFRQNVDFARGNVERKDSQFGIPATDIPNMEPRRLSVGRDIGKSTTSWRRIGGVEVHLHSFLTSALDGSEWSSSGPGSFTAGKEPQYLLIGGWVEGSAGWRFGEIIFFKKVLVSSEEYWVKLQNALRIFL